jgi:hypothetical protein
MRLHGPHSPPSHDQASVFGASQRFAQSGAADGELVGELRLGREALAGAQRSEPGTEAISRRSPVWAAIRLSVHRIDIVALVGKDTPE